MIVPKSDIRNAVTTNATLREQLLKHPQLVAAYMQTAAMDFDAGIIAQQVRAGLELIAERLEPIAENLSNQGKKSVAGQPW